MTQPIFVQPKLRDEQANSTSWFVAQNLPSVVCGHVLDPRPGQTILDMCAAPGGKSCHIATLMQNEGRLICVDESAKRLENLIDLARRQNITCIETFCKDSAQLFRDQKNFPPEFFDRILLDAPCSGSGNRPASGPAPESLAKTLPPKQRKLLNCAVKLLKVGGVLVYSTCSLNKSENEENVEWFLAKFPEMELSSQDPFSVVDTNMASSNKGLQKFDPTLFCPIHRSQDATTGCIVELSDSNSSDRKSSNFDKNCLTCDQDTIGFFIAKFSKKNLLSP